MLEAAMQSDRNSTIRRLWWPVIFALVALVLLSPAEASAQIFPPQPWEGNDRCAAQSAPLGKFKAANEGWSYLNISLGQDSAPGSVALAMYGTSAPSGECIRPQPYVCSASTCAFEVQAVCEFHCLHDHTPPYPWTVELFPTSGYLVAWPGTACLPRKDAARSSCVVQMPTPGGTTTATAKFEGAPDLAPPTPAPVATVSSVESYSMMVSWTPSSDLNWLGGYDIFNGATLLTRVGPGTTSTRLQSLSCQTPYNIRVVAFDARNEATSNTVAVTTGACLRNSDTTPPNTVFHVTPPRTTRSRTAYFHWGASEASRFRCKFDRGLWRKCRLSDPYVTLMGKTYRRLSRGYHAFRVRAIDKAGNVDPTPARWVWRIRR